MWVKRKWLVVSGVLLALFWYRTNSWPVVAVVNGVPVTRFELNQLMYARVGQDAVEDLLMRRIINREIANRKIKVTDGEVAERLNKLKEQIGSEESYKQALAIQGMTEAQLKGQIRIQTALEKMVDPSTDSAKLQQEVGDLVRSLRGKAVVWKVLTGGK